MQGTDALSSNVVGLIGEPLEFTSATEFDSATITFQIDREKLENLVEVEDARIRLTTSLSFGIMRKKVSLRKCPRTVIR